MKKRKKEESNCLIVRSCQQQTIVNNCVLQKILTPKNGCRREEGKDQKMSGRKRERAEKERKKMEEEKEREEER